MNISQQRVLDEACSHSKSWCCNAIGLRSK
uniref:Uncharacterized protein n=1 Tax=Lepeophtheirus salmonis TaxID=72036 RepID=A0A0K2TBC2_LEPSM